MSRLKMRRTQCGQFTTYEFIGVSFWLMFIVVMAVVGGYFANIFKLLSLIGHPISDIAVELILRLIGVIAIPIGVIAGYC